MNSQAQAGSTGKKDGDELSPPEAGATRYDLAAEEELRLEINFQPNRASGTCTLTLQRGSCELWGVELAVGKSYTLCDDGGLKIALFTWHGCTLDVSCDAPDLIAYTTDETTCNVAYVNTHAQLEALRDQAAAALVASQVMMQVQQQQQQDQQQQSSTTDNDPLCDGPRVLVCGPAECGKSTLCKILTAYACKLGRSPVLVDLDPHDAGLISGVPGTLGAAPMTAQAISLENFATHTGAPPGAASPLLLWHGQDPETSQGDKNKDGGGKSDNNNDSGNSNNNNSKIPITPELFRAQVSQLAARIDQRLLGDDLARASGLIVNTNGWIEGEGFDLLLHAVQALRIHIVLVLGHDRLYSMLRSKLMSNNKSNNTNTTAAAQSSNDGAKPVKVIKLPRSGGVVSRGSTFIQRLRNRSIKQYFYGALMERPNILEGSSGNNNGSSNNNNNSAAANNNAATPSPTSRVPQLTPFLLQIPYDTLTIYKFSSIRLSASLLPVAAAQMSQSIQLVPVLKKGVKATATGDGSADHNDDNQLITTEERALQVLQHHVLAVCHRQAVQAYEKSGQASDLYLSGVAGFCTVERMQMDKLHLLSPCAGSLPSDTLLMGNITWME